MAAISTAGVLCVVFVSCVIVPGLATVYTVGDSAGWAMGVDYGTWAAGKTFAPGDSIVFNYAGGHTVDEVKSSDYTSCTVSNAITSDSSGATTVKLQAPGTRYFICGIPGHCGSGMKLTVPVTAAASSATPPTPSDATNAPPSTTTTPPAGSSDDTPSGSTTTDAPPSASTTPASTPKTTVNPPASTKTVPSSSVIISPFPALIASWAAIMWKLFL